MSVLVWFRDKLYGKSYVTPTPVNPQITDAVTQTSPVISTAVTDSIDKSKKSTAAKAKKTK